MKKKVLKKWATRIIRASNFKYNTDEGPVDIAYTDKTVSGKFVARALANKSFKHYMKEELGIIIMPTFKYDEERGNIYMDRYFDKNHKYYFDTFIKDMDEKAESFVNVAK